MVVCRELYDIRSLWIRLAGMWNQMAGQDGRTAVPDIPVSGVVDALSAVW